MWRPVVEGKATLHEIETHWSVVDLLDANEALDLQWEADRRASEPPKKRGS